MNKTLNKTLNKSLRLKSIACGLVLTVAGNTFGSEAGTYGAHVVQGVVTSAGMTTYCAPSIKVEIHLPRSESCALKPANAQMTSEKKTIPSQEVKDFIELNLPVILDVESDED